MLFVGWVLDLIKRILYLNFELRLRFVQNPLTSEHSEHNLFKTLHLETTIIITSQIVRHRKKTIYDDLLCIYSVSEM